MFSSNLIKFFFAVALLSGQSCSLWQSKTDATATPAPFVAEELKSEIPFATKEPDVYQTEIVVIAAGNEFEEKTFVAKNDANRLIVFGFQEKHETALLQLGENQSYLIARSQKVFADNKSATFDNKETDLNNFLTAEWLNQKTDAKFETLGAENNLAKYRVRLNDSPNSEIVIYIDEKIGLPVREEFYKTSGEQRIVTLTMEMRNFSLQADANLFEIPKDYRKVSLKEFQEIRQREMKKND